jgi:hypothetical protein
MDPKNPSAAPTPTEAELKSWSWGAFGLSWIWGIAHRSPIALLVFVPVVGWFGMPFVLGRMGNRWAWRNRRWSDPEAFRRSQRAWAQAALSLWSAALFTAGLGAIVTTSALTTSDAFQLAKSELREDPQLTQLLGQPIVFGTPSGNLQVGGGGSGSAELRVAVSGAKSHGEAFIVARRALGVWHLEAVELELADGSRVGRTVLQGHASSVNTPSH